MDADPCTRIVLSMDIIISGSKARVGYWLKNVFVV
jgi:hypothetical protein